MDKWWWVEQAHDDLSRVVGKCVIHGRYLEHILFIGILYYYFYSYSRNPSNAATSFSIQNKEITKVENIIFSLFAADTTNQLKVIIAAALSIHHLLYSVLI